MTIGNQQNKILIFIVIAQFCCTSLWFAGNGVMDDLIASYGLNEQAIGHLTAAVQFGFIGGTLLFALLTISDRFSPSRVFFVSALMAAFFNLGMIVPGNNLITLVNLRFLTGFFLAGIYPVGMKIAADHFDQKLGKSLGYLVGALVVGTSFPHLLKAHGGQVAWTVILISTSILAVAGGVIIQLFVADGPFRKAARGLDISVLVGVFKERQFRGAAIGYFGHMWELYAFWAFVPLMVSTYADMHPGLNWNISLLSFYIIGIGGLGCVLAGYWSQVIGEQKVAGMSLAVSGLCCLLSPFFFQLPNEYLFLSCLLLWGTTVVADSPLFSTLVAKHANPTIKGSALTVVNCLGFSLTIISIQLINQLQIVLNPTYLYVPLVIGPIVGLFALLRTKY